MPDSEELEKKEKREFMRETIVKPPLTRKQIVKRQPHLEESQRFRLQR